ncbi:MAG: hypothetical protein QOG04_110 [Actinomycetota bacterium]|jgi:hypothetical protein|nr:hypothetical protein [Actinomycetota bacterium]
MKRTLTAALVLALCVVGLTPAFAHHRQPPRAILKAPQAWQKGVLGTHCWNYFDKGSDEGVGFCADSLHSFPEPDSSTAGADATIRLWANRLPKEASVDVWTEVDENGQPVGDPERLVSTLKPHRKDGVIVAYDLRFQLPDGAGDLYLNAFAKWGALRFDDGRADGDAFYDFHLTTS